VNRWQQPAAQAGQMRQVVSRFQHAEPAPQPVRRPMYRQYSQPAPEPAYQPQRVARPPNYRQNSLPVPAYGQPIQQEIYEDHFDQRPVYEPVRPRPVYGQPRIYQESQRPAQQPVYAQPRSYQPPQRPVQPVQKPAHPIFVPQPVQYYDEEPIYEPEVSDIFFFTIFKSNFFPEF
jgi:hypothetical protein